MTTDWPDDNPSAHRALAIYGQTVPLAAKSVPLQTVTTSNVLPGATSTVGPITVGQIGYEIGIDIGANAASTSPVMRVLFTWTDSSTGRITEQQRWNLVGAASPSVQTYFGVGPSSGDTLSIAITNDDLVNGMTYAFVLASNSRVYVRHDWRQQTFNTVPSLVLGNYDPAGHLLLQAGPNVNPGATVSRLIPLYCGTVRIWCTFALAFDLVITAIDRTIGVAPAGFQIWEQAVTAAGGGVITAELALPRSICLINFTNNGAAANAFGFSMVAKEQQP